MYLYLRPVKKDTTIANLCNQCILSSSPSNAEFSTISDFLKLSEYKTITTFYSEDYYLIKSNLYEQMCSVEKLTYSKPFKFDTILNFELLTTTSSTQAVAVVENNNNNHHNILIDGNKPTPDVIQVSISMNDNDDAQQQQSWSHEVICQLYQLLGKFVKQSDYLENSSVTSSSSSSSSSSTLDNNWKKEQHDDRIEMKHDDASQQSILLYFKNKKAATTTTTTTMKLIQQFLRFRVGDILPEFTISRIIPLLGGRGNDDDDEGGYVLILSKLLDRPLIPVTKDHPPLLARLEPFRVEQQQHPHHPPPHCGENNDNDYAQIELRPVAAPFFDGKIIMFPEELSLLLHPEALQQITRECLEIQNEYISWPETTLSSSSSSSGGGGSYSAGSEWTVFPLCYTFPGNDVSRRRFINRTCQVCEKTVRLLKLALGDKLRTALFSKLAPGAALTTHTGWEDLANHVLRVHIPLVIPEFRYKHHQGSSSSSSSSGCSDVLSTCGLWVNGCNYYYQKETAIVFDDSQVHRAFNYSNTEDRFVLIVDIERPSYLPKGQAVGGHTEELDGFIQQFG